MPKRLGRPTKRPKPGVRVPLSLRVTAEVRLKLEEAAIENGRSLSQEAEFRLEDSFSKGEALAMMEELRAAREENRHHVEEIKAQLADLSAKARRR